MSCISSGSDLENRQGTPALTLRGGTGEKKILTADKESIPREKASVYAKVPPLEKPLVEPGGVIL